MNRLALYLITLLGLCLTQPMAQAMSVQWTDYGYDNNGNVTELYDGDSGEIVGQYEYDPYGNTIKAEGQAARENKIRFSTKEYDSSTGLYYYGYRYYDPVTGRWPSRDPIGERGGVNLYGFVGNDPLSKSDYLGQQPSRNCCGGKKYVKSKSCCQNDTIVDRIPLWDKYGYRDDEDCAANAVPDLASDTFWDGTKYVFIQVIPGGDCSRISEHW